MTWHYHGTPLSPRPLLYELAGRNFCVSYAEPRDVEVCHRIGQSVMLDNGAYTFWQQGKEPVWTGYAEWAKKWLGYRTTWAVIPDVIDGTEEENDRLIRAWPHSLLKQSAPVWHMNEPLDRLGWLCNSFERVCIGSSGAYREIGTTQWHHRMEAVFNYVAPHNKPPWLHMLRGMSLVGGPYPFASVDSVDVARNFAGNNQGRARKSPGRMAARWDAMQCPATWTFREQQSFEAA